MKPSGTGSSIKLEENRSNSYRNIIKGSSFFGGVQVFNILISLIRGKFVAIILGPEGMGIAALFNSAGNTIQRFASLGLNQSVIKEVADGSLSEEKRKQTIKTSLLLIKITSLIGLIVCGALCLPLSRLTFGTPDYWWQFLILAVSVGLMVNASGKLALLQALHQVKKISKASVYGGLSGLCIGIPLYFLFGDKGIVPAIVAVSITLYIFYSISLSKTGVRLSGTLLNLKELWPIGKKLLLLGIVLMAGELISTLVGYGINLFIRDLGSTDDVGLYQAATSVTTQFSGVIFAALAMDYFPRLSKVAKDNSALKLAVNRQSEIVSWLMTPAMCLLILATPLLIRVLLAESFHSIIPLMRWMGIGMFFRAISFPMAYITFAKGNKKVFFLLEGLTANILTFVLSCIFYYYFGLIGLGYALVADNAICFILYFFVNHKLYDYNFSIAAAVGFLFGSLLTLGCFFSSFFLSNGLAYSLMSVTAIMALVWGGYNLRKKFLTS